MLRTASAACVVILSSYTGATYLRLVFFSLQSSGYSTVEDVTPRNRHLPPHSILHRSASLKAEFLHFTEIPISFDHVVRTTYRFIISFHCQLMVINDW
jgi:hypothetical protein